MGPDGEVAWTRIDESRGSIVVRSPPPTPVSSRGQGPFAVRQSVAAQPFSALTAPGADPQDTAGVREKRDARPPACPPPWARRTKFSRARRSSSCRRRGCSGRSGPSHLFAGARRTSTAVAAARRLAPGSGWARWSRASPASSSCQQRRQRGRGPGPHPRQLRLAQRAGGPRVRPGGRRLACRRRPRPHRIPIAFTEIDLWDRDLRPQAARCLAARDHGSSSAWPSPRWARAGATSSTTRTPRCSRARWTPRSVLGDAATCSSWARS